jgi:archaellum component FlaF (FlaF/FlaG flagellin family)
MKKKNDDTFDTAEDENGAKFNDAESDDSPIIADTKGKKLNNRMFMIFAAIVVVVALVFSGYMWIHIRNANNTISDDARNRSSLGTSDTSSDSKTTSSGTEIDTQYLGSVGVPDYYMVLKNDMSADQKTKADSAAVALAPSNTDSALASKSANPNLTDDESKAYNADKSMNPNYSFLTAENVSTQVRDDIERIINPIYGGWATLQSASSLNNSDKPIAGFADMFTSADGKASAVSSASVADSSKILPLFADWGANDFNGRYPSRSYQPIVGTAGVLNCTYNIQGTMDDTISCNMVVTYHAKMSDGSTKTENKTLTINYKPNYDDNTESRRIMIDSVQQD